MPFELELVFDPLELDPPNMLDREFGICCADATAAVPPVRTGISSRLAASRFQPHFLNWNTMASLPSSAGSPDLG